MRTLDDTQLDLAFQTYGDVGPPVVILHGLLGSRKNWTSIARRLSADYRVFALDLRNHGQSPWAPAMTYDDQAADVAAFIEKHDLAPACVVGHSMGGKAGMRLALAQGELVDRLAVVDIAPVGYEGHGFEDYIEAMRQANLSTGSRDEVEASLTDAVPSSAVRAFLMQNLAREESGLRWRPNLKALAAAMPDLMDFPTAAGEQYQGPTLFLVGEHGDYVTDEHRSGIMSLFPKGRIEHIKDAGHWVHAEQPDAFLERLSIFLA